MPGEYGFASERDECLSRPLLERRSAGILDWESFDADLVMSSEGIDSARVIDEKKRNA
jgi:hypothetical protein